MPQFVTSSFISIGIIEVALDNSKIKSWVRPRASRSSQAVNSTTVGPNIANYGTKKYGSSFTADRNSSRFPNRLSVGYLETEHDSDSGADVDEFLDEKWKAVDNLSGEATNFEAKLKQRGQRLALKESLNLFIIDLATKFQQIWNEDAEAAKTEHACNEAINLGTIHSSKGREWSVVVLIDADNENFVSGDEGSNLDPEQDRNLAYVACSRAKERLYISYVGPSQGSEQAHLGNIFKPLKRLVSSGQAVLRSFPYEAFKQADNVQRKQRNYIKDMIDQQTKADEGTDSWESQPESEPDMDQTFSYPVPPANVRLSSAVTYGRVKSESNYVKIEKVDSSTQINSAAARALEFKPVGGLATSSATYSAPVTMESTNVKTERIAAMQLQASTAKPSEMKYPAIQPTNYLGAVSAPRVSHNWAIDASARRYDSKNSCSRSNNSGNQSNENHRLNGPSAGWSAPSAAISAAVDLAATDEDDWEAINACLEVEAMMTQSSQPQPSSQHGRRSLD
jgi:hypothetical protein